jgi:hypothetical protein|tara:strand:- start:379 stop:777 length:399 start_codon:yes stop_codon:yes gene_type:complete
VKKKEIAMSNIDGLASEWLELKKAERKLIAQRHAIEEQLTKALDAKDEGSVTHKLEDHKVTLSQSVTRKIDLVKWEEVKHKIPEDRHPVKSTLSADSVGVRWLLDNNPKQWAKVAEAFETKKAKIGVKVEAY